MIMNKGINPVIEVRHICKSYGTVKALQDVSLSIQRGELFGLIGPDGAGKSTLFRILTTLLNADSGEASVIGYDVHNDFRCIRSEIGYMPGRFSLYQDLTVEENLNFFATIFQTTVAEHYDQIREIYEQIAPFRKRRTGALSGGMKQKLALCCALIHSPKVLFLDEPTTGVDPVSRKEFWMILDRLRNRGITIMVSTPFMDEARKCDRIAFLHEGKIRGTDTPAIILEQFKDILCPPGLERNCTEDSQTPVIKVNNLVKRFGTFTAIDHISFEVRKGEIFGFLGANGAGKTTAMRILCGLSLPTEGHAEVMGYNVITQSEDIKRHIGYMSQKFSLYEDLTVWEMYVCSVVSIEFLPKKYPNKQKRCFTVSDYMKNGIRWFGHSLWDGNNVWPFRSPYFIVRNLCFSTNRQEGLIPQHDVSFGNLSIRRLNKELPYSSPLTIWMKQNTATVYQLW